MISNGMPGYFDVASEDAIQLSTSEMTAVRNWTSVGMLRVIPYRLIPSAWFVLRSWTFRLECVQEITRYKAV